MMEIWNKLLIYPKCLHLFYCLRNSWWKMKVKISECANWNKYKTDKRDCMLHILCDSQRKRRIEVFSPLTGRKRW